MEADIKRLLDSWEHGYQCLSDLSMEQFLLVKDAKEDEVIWDRIGELAEEKNRRQDELEQIQERLLQSLGHSEVQRLFEERIRKSAESARLLTFEASRKIEILMLSVGKDLGATRNHRTVLNAYQGSNVDDRVAYYFDEKK